MKKPNMKISDLYKSSMSDEWVFHVFPDRWELVNPQGIVYHSNEGEMMEPAERKIVELGMKYRIEDHRIILL